MMTGTFKPGPPLAPTLAFMEAIFDQAHVAPTTLLDFRHPSIQQLVDARRLRDLPIGRRIGAVYELVRDEIRFGYNASDQISASEVLRDGYGQCNTKTTLVMALLRAVGVPCRFHGATIHKRLQKGVVTGLLYALAPRNIVHSWAEVLVDGRWVALEGVILDKAYLDGLRRFVARESGAFLGFGVGTEDLGAPRIEWKGEDTAVQMTGVNQDFGTFADPDTFYARHGGNLKGLKAWLFRVWWRHRMNRRVAAIRACEVVGAAAPGLCGKPEAA